jgi:hypothetical protein
MEIDNKNIEKMNTLYLGAGVTKTVQTFANDNEIIRFRNLVEEKSKMDFKLLENEGKTFSEVSSKVYNELMHIYLSRDLKGFENFDTLNLTR